MMDKQLKGRLKRFKRDLEEVALIKVGEENSGEIQITGEIQIMLEETRKYLGN